MADQESSNALLARFVRAISEVDLTALVSLSTQEIRISIPGARDVDLTTKNVGVDSLCTWAKRVHDECGNTTFHLHRYFENGCEIVAVGEIHIERLPGGFTSPCSIHLVLEGGLVASFQLLLDTFALEKFRGRAD